MYEVRQKWSLYLGTKNWKTVMSRALCHLTSQCFDTVSIRNKSENKSALERIILSGEPRKETLKTVPKIHSG